MVCQRDVEVTDYYRFFTTLVADSGKDENSLRKVDRVLVWFAE